ncbi:hypothetical protein [Luteithermobacter gelatinilyticus]|uniref:hypothetical protein n=1 Tax=Luteithermobacter gelatinilyticus TaxID=2582913 RepID=UPI0011059AB9|nr:hypothetical protein [Luteithermobacter gelatinilyticus]
MFKTSAIILASTLILGSVSTAALADCTFPKRPEIPDGTTVSKEDLMATIREFKNRFQPAVKDFQRCIENEKAIVGDLATEDQIAEWDAKYNAAYEIEARLANQLNETIRAFKARQAKDKAKDKASDSPGKQGSQ